MKRVHSFHQQLRSELAQYAIIFQVLGAVLALFFIFLTYMNTKTWRWVHVTIMFLVFVAASRFASMPR